MCLGQIVREKTKELSQAKVGGWCSAVVGKKMTERISDIKHECGFVRMVSDMLPCLSNPSSNTRVSLPSHLNP